MSQLVDCGIKVPSYEADWAQQRAACPVTAEMRSVCYGLVFLRMVCRMQEDKRLLARVDTEVKKYKTPVNVIHLRNEHHALDLWEGVCQTGADFKTQPPILLLPEGYALEDRQAKLQTMGKLYKANELVSMSAQRRKKFQGPP